VDNIKPDNQWIVGLKQLHRPAGPLAKFEKTMNKLMNKLTFRTGAGQQLTWMLGKQEIKEVLSKIERFKSLITMWSNKDLW
jgi:hypothetical protein